MLFFTTFIGMKNRCIRMAVILLVAAAASAHAQDFPRSYKWLSNNEVAFTMDGTYTDDAGFTLQLGRKTVRQEGVNAPEKFADFPIKP